MLIRIVKITFQEEGLSAFLALFAEQKTAIRAFEGCEHLELWQDQHDPRICFTYSHWVNEEALQQYRNSELFRQTWKKTKVLFAERPEAWTLQPKG